MNGPDLLRAMYRLTSVFSLTTRFSGAKWTGGNSSRVAAGRRPRGVATKGARVKATLECFPRGQHALAFALEREGQHPADAGRRTLSEMIRVPTVPASVQHMGSTMTRLSSLQLQLRSLITKRSQGRRRHLMNRLGAL